MIEPGHERRDQRAPLVVAMIDPGGFSPAYDEALVAELRSLGHDVRLFTTPTALSGRISAKDYPIFPASISISRQGIAFKLALLVKGIRYLSALTRLVTELWRLRPDVIHWQWLPLPIFDAIAIRMCRALAPNIFTLHDAKAFNGSASNLIQLKGVDSARALMNATIVHSNFGKREAESLNCTDPSPIFVIPHGAFTHYRAFASGIERRTNTVLLIGSIKPYKGVLDLLEAFAKVDSTVRDGWKVIVAGQPSMPTDTLIAARKRLSLEDSVNFVFQTLSEREFGRLISESGLVVLPYHEIDQSGVLMSAMALGATIVATDVGAFPETLEMGKAGIVVRAGSIQALTSAIQSLIKSPSERARLGVRARLRADSELSWREAATKTVNLYRSLDARPKAKMPSVGREATG